MSSLLDSKAQFAQRLSECKVPEKLCKALEDSGISSLATLAYSHGQPGQPIDDARFSEWVRSMEPNASIGAVAQLKRLLFESQTQLLALLKEQVTQPDTYVAKKIPQAERESRLTNLKQRLVGQLIEGPSEPAHCLLDATNQMHEKNQITYLSPDRCVSRLHELTAAKSNEKMLEIESSKLIVKDRTPDLEVSAKSSLQVLEAFRRRGLALDFSDVMSFGAHEKYMQSLFSHMHRDAPPGYSQCTISQLVEADKAAWSKCIRDNVKPRRDSTGAKPLDTALVGALETWEVSFSLMPLPSRQSAPKSVNKSEGGKPKPDKPQPSAKHVANKFQNNKKSKGKGRGKSKWEPKCPQAIRDAGGTATLPSGEPLCFGYSLSGCSKAADGARCEKGHHVCPICYGPHSLKDHPR